MALLFQDCSWTEAGGSVGWIWFFFSPGVCQQCCEVGNWQGTAHARSCSSASPLHPFLITNHSLGNRSRALQENSVLSVSADYSKTCGSRPNIVPLIGGAEDKPSGHCLAVVGVMLGYPVLLGMKHNTNAVNVMDKLVMVLWMILKIFLKFLRRF